MPETIVRCTKCGREYDTYSEASHCERTDAIMEATASQIARHLSQTDQHEIVKAIARGLMNAGYISPAVNPAPREPAHGHPEPGT